MKSNKRTKKIVLLLYFLLFGLTLLSIFIHTDIKIEDANEKEYNNEVNNKNHPKASGFWVLPPIEIDGDATVLMPII